MRGLKPAILSRDVALVVALSVVVGLGFNALQPRGISLIAKEPYRILVPCPVAGGEVTPLAAADVRWGGTDDLVIDARTTVAFTEWTAPGAWNVPYDFLDEVSLEVVEELVATPVERVVVFGDGLVPDTGRELGAEVSGKGARNVYYVEGGAPAVRAFLEPEEVAPTTEEVAP